MKKIDPNAAIFSVIMLGFAAASYYFDQNIYLCIAELTVGLASGVAFVIFSVRSRRYIKRVVSAAVAKAAGADIGYLNNHKYPILVLGENDEVIWFNSSFGKCLSMSDDIIGADAERFLSGKSLSDILTSPGTDVSFSDKEYTVFGNRIEKSTVLCFFEVTEYKKIERELKFSLPTVAMIVLDNREDFISDNEDESPQIISNVEVELQKWAAEYHALYKRITGNRYMIVFQERDIQNLVDTKFKILDKIREIKFHGRAATISAGIGRGCFDVSTSEQYARQALDMALGRGGDQVAVVQDDEYTFFGGIERAAEKRSKVKARVIAETLQKAIGQCDRVVVMGHKYSDFDCLGSAIGLYGAVTKAFEKPCSIVVDAERSLARPMIEKYSKEKGKNVFVPESAVLPSITNETLLIIVDTHSPEFVESENVYKKCKNIVVIDHHRKVINYIKNALVFYHEPYCSSASEMVTEILGYMGDKTLEKIEAESLLAGIMLDTKNFVIKTGVRTFEAATYLKQKGADSVEACSLFADDIETYKKKTTLAGNAEILNGCAITSCDETMKNGRVIAAQTANTLLSLAGVNASFVIFMSEDKTVNISARSHGKMNVQIIMEALGGGGHQTMAATQLSDTTVKDVKKRLVSVLKEKM